MKNTEWNEEERRNIVGVFQILIDVDRRINPHLYKKSISVEINKDYTDKQPDNSIPIMSENS